MPADLSPRKKQILIITAVGAIVLALGIWFTNRRSDDAIAPTTDFHYICKSCNNRFGLSTKELNAFQASHYGQPVQCPKCKSTELIHAIRCDSCGEYYPLQRGQEQVCPKCGAKPKTAS